MRVLLMHPDRDWREAAALTERFRTFRVAPPTPRSVPEQTLSQDLAFETLLAAMADGDDFLYDAAERALFSGTANEIDTIRHRQAVLEDCLKHPSMARALYAVLVEAIAGERRFFVVDYARHPGSILYHAIDTLRWHMDKLRKLRGIADEHAARVTSPGLTALFALMHREFSDEYLGMIDAHLDTLRAQRGTTLSASLGRGNESTQFAFHQPSRDGRGWFARLFVKESDGYRFSIHERDEAGARALGDLHDQAINATANALAQSAQHILGFFEVLRAEIAFYVGCLNLHERLTGLGMRTCMPKPCPFGGREHRFEELYDMCLTLQMNKPVVGNTVDADGMSVLIITGANQGGKSTFLRSVGLAQMMMQSGMFVGARAFTAALAAGVFSHYRREEDATMQHGKLDEELSRMSGIVGAIGPHALLLCNESFASTNEVEGSEIARQVVTALLDKRIKVVFVTHLYMFARGLWEQQRRDALFLRADRLSDGTRTFQLMPREPLETSYGEDLYREIFGTEAATTKALGLSAS